MTVSSSSSTTKTSKSLLTRTRMRTSWRRRRATTTTMSSSASSKGSRAACSDTNENDSVSEKLMALKNLVPTTTSRNQEDVAADELFQETADYILRLRTQVFVLQHLIQFYDKDNDDENNNNDNAIVL